MRDGLSQASGTLREHCLSLVQGADLTVTGDYSISSVRGGRDGVVVLAESHLAIHTWPEKMSVTVDVYVCNYGSDNREKARRRSTRCFHFCTQGASHMRHRSGLAAPAEARGDESLRER